VVTLAASAGLSVSGAAGAAAGGVTKTGYGKAKTGGSVDLYTLKNTSGVEVNIITYGARIQAIRCPDAHGKVADISLGFDNLQGYEGDNPYFGAIVGRYGNRIAKGTFELDGKTWHLPINDGPNSLHGGTRGFDKRVWTAKEVGDSGGPAVELTYVSKDGEEGYPGTMTTVVRYTLTANNELRLDYTLSTDKDTVANVTNHNYFNLSGEGSGDILKHQIQINADRFTPVDATLIPTGELRPVQGTPFDFRQPHAIGERIGSSDEQIKRGKGYDHNFVLNGQMGTLRQVVHVVDPASGRTLDVSTTEPGVQFYTGNFLDGKVKGKGGKPYNFRGAFCLETQHFPDSPNHPSFPTTKLTIGSPRKSTTVFRFGVQKG